MPAPESIPTVNSIIKHDRVLFADHNLDVQSALPSRAGTASKQGQACKKSVQLLREKDVVHAIEVRCSCGELTVVEIEYGPQPS